VNYPCKIYHIILIKISKLNTFDSIQIKMIILQWIKLNVTV